jgi:hypothetical protein
MEAGPAAGPVSAGYEYRVGHNAGDTVLDQTGVRVVGEPARMARFARQLDGIGKPEAQRLEKATRQCLIKSQAWRELDEQDSQLVAEAVHLFDERGDQIIGVGETRVVRNGLWDLHREAKRRGHA